VKAERWLQRSKQNVEIVSTDEGMRIDRSDEQSSNADWPSIETLQLASNFTLESCAQW
jgi:hypothetical protein